MADASLNAGFAVSVAKSISAAQSSLVDITIDTVVKTGSGRLGKVSVVVAGSAVGTVHDCATTGAASAANQIGTVPNTVGTTDFDWPVTDGLVIKIGTAQTLAVSYS